MPMTLMKIKSDHVAVKALDSESFKDVPALKSDSQITKLEEEKVSAFVAGGYLHSPVARPSKMKALGQAPTSTNQLKKWRRPMPHDHDDFEIEPVEPAKQPPRDEHPLAVVPARSDWREAFKIGWITLYYSDHPLARHRWL